MNTVVYSVLASILIISLMSIINTMYTNIILKKREYGVLRAVGMTGRQLSLFIASEGFLYGITSWVAGTVLGLAGCVAIFKMLTKDMVYLWETPWLQVLISFGLCMLGSGIAVLMPLKRINKMNIIEEINMED